MSRSDSSNSSFEGDLVEPNELSITKREELVSREHEATWQVTEIACPFIKPNLIFLICYEDEQNESLPFYLPENISFTSPIALTLCF